MEYGTSETEKNAPEVKYTKRIIWGTTVSRTGIRVVKTIKITPNEKARIVSNINAKTATGKIRICGMVAKYSTKIAIIKAKMAIEILHSITRRERTRSIGLICLYASNAWFAEIEDCNFVTDFVKNKTVTIPVTRKIIRSISLVLLRRRRMK